MKILFISIELLIGTYFIEISHDYILAYLKSNDEPKINEIYIVDKKKKLVYHSFDREGNYKIDTITDSPVDEYSLIKILSSDSECRYMNFDCIKYTCHFRNKHNWGFPTGKFEAYCSHVQVIDQYLPDKSLINYLHPVGKHYNTFGMYTLASYEVTSGEKNKVLLHKVKKIEEREEFSSGGQPYIDLIRYSE